MKLPPPKNRFFSRPWFWVLIFIIVLTAVGATYAFIKRSSDTAVDTPVNTVDYSPPSQEEVAETTNTKEEAIESAEEQKPSETNTAPEDVTVTISRTTQADIGEPLSIRALVEGTQSGDCKFTFSQPGQTDITKVVAIKFQATSASCNLDVPMDQFPTDGGWTITVALDNGAQDTAAVEIKK